MAKSSITPGAGVSTEAPSNLPATQSQGQVVPQNDGAKYDDGSRDVIIPRLGLINKIGPLSTKFPRNVGQYAFEERLVLGDQIPGRPVGESVLKVIAVAVRKFYVEIKRNGVDLKYGDNIQAKTFNSANAANQAGYAIDFDSNCPNKVQEAGEVLFLVPGPADDPAGAFYIDIDGKSYAAALMTFRRGSFRDAWKVINTVKVRNEARNSELFSTVFDLTSTLVENKEKQQAWFESRAIASGRVSADGLVAIRKQIPSLLGKAESTASQAE